MYEYECEEKERKNCMSTKHEMFSFGKSNEKAHDPQLEFFFHTVHILSIFHIAPCKHYPERTH